MSMPSLMTLRATSRWASSVLLGTVHYAHPALAQGLAEHVGADLDRSVEGVLRGGALRLSVAVGRIGVVGLGRVARSHDTAIRNSEVEGHVLKLWRRSEFGDG